MLEKKKFCITFDNVILDQDWELEYNAMRQAEDLNEITATESSIVTPVALGPRERLLIVFNTASKRVDLKIGIEGPVTQVNERSFANIPLSSLTNGEGIISTDTKADSGDDLYINGEQQLRVDSNSLGPFFIHRKGILFKIL